MAAQGFVDRIEKLSAKERESGLVQIRQTLTECYLFDPAKLDELDALIDSAPTPAQVKEERAKRKDSSKDARRQQYEAQFAALSLEEQQRENLILLYGLIRLLELQEQRQRRALGVETDADMHDHRN